MNRANRVDPEDLVVASQDEPQGYRGPQACKIVGITYRQLDYWAREGILTPSVADASGSGTQRLYSYTDLLLLKLVKKLLDNGLSMQTARRALSTARDLIASEPQSLEYLVVDSTQVLVRDGSDVINLLRRGQLHFGVLVSLETLKEDLRSDVAALDVSPAKHQPALFGSMVEAS